MEGRGKRERKTGRKKKMEEKLSAYLAWFCCVKLEGNDQMLCIRRLLPGGKIIFETHHKQVSKTRGRKSEKLSSNSSRWECTV